MSSCKSILKKRLHNGQLTQEEYDKLIRNLTIEHRCVTCKHAYEQRRLSCDNTTSLYCLRLIRFVEANDFCSKHERIE